MFTLDGSRKVREVKKLTNASIIESNGRGICIVEFEGENWMSVPRPSRGYIQLYPMMKLGG